jgi:hypothetical protein
MSQRGSSRIWARLGSGEVCFQRLAGKNIFWRAVTAISAPSNPTLANVVPGPGGWVMRSNRIFYWDGSRGEAAGLYPDDHSYL